MAKRTTTPEAPAPVPRATRRRSAASEHPWARPALRSRDAATRTRVQAFYDAHRSLAEAAFGTLSLGVLVPLATAADLYEMTATVPMGAKERRALAREAHDELRHAWRMAKLEGRARRPHALA